MASKAALAQPLSWAVTKANLLVPLATGTPASLADSVPFSMCVRNPSSQKVGDVFGNPLSLADVGGAGAAVRGLAKEADARTEGIMGG